MFVYGSQNKHQPIGFITEMECVYCAVRIGSLNKIESFLPENQVGSFSMLFFGPAVNVSLLTKFNFSLQIFRQPFQKLNKKFSSEVSPPNTIQSLS
jgi:hypothetical protein